MPSLLFLKKSRKIWNCHLLTHKVPPTKILMQMVAWWRLKILQNAPWSILQYFWPALSDNYSWKPIRSFVTFLHASSLLLYLQIHYLAKMVAVYIVLIQSEALLHLYMYHLTDSLSCQDSSCIYSINPIRSFVTSLHVSSYRFIILPR